MKKVFTVTGLIYLTLVVLTVSKAKAQQAGADIIAADAKPTVFLQDGVTVPNDESAPTFTPDGKTVYMANHQTIVMSQMVNHKWTKPVPIAISGHWKDWDPTLTPDGKKLVFVSNRPLADTSQKVQKVSHLWYATYLGKQTWSEPRQIDETGYNAYAPSLSRAGSLCFCSHEHEGEKKMRGYYTKWLGNHYDKPKLLMLNGDKEIFDPYISPDERFIIFASEKNLYISYRNGEGWSAGQKLGPQVNNSGENGDPYVSLDGKTLYYNSSLTDGILMIPVNIPHHGKN